MINLLQSHMGRLRVLAFMEGVSFLVILFITMPLKYLYHNPMPNKIVGMAHGVLFLGYVVVVIQVHLNRNWPMKKTGLALLASIVPFGTFWADVKLFRAENG